MRAVDTNVLIRLLTEDDPAQLAVARNFIVDGAWMSHVVLAEATWVLRANYGFAHERIAASIEDLLTKQHIVIQDADTVIAALAHYRARPSLGFTDCLVLEIARKARHLPLGTFDRHLGRLDGAQRL
jgi:predicted nucleic-acid-binding protein